MRYYIKSGVNNTKNIISTNIVCIINSEANIVCIINSEEI
jgi:hypothetical protein